MQIMSLNAWGGKLHTALLPYVAKTAPDILCLQEVIHSPDTEAPWLTYRDGDHVLPQRANLFHEIRQALPDHVATFCPAAQGALWDGDRPVPSQWGLATFVHGSPPIIGQAQGFVHKSWSPEGYGDHPRSRTAHAVRLHDFGRNRQISVTHMHGLRDPAGKHDTPARAAQARRLLDLSRRVSEPDDLTVICGDFNVEPDSETLLGLFREPITFADRPDEPVSLQSVFDNLFIPHPLFLILHFLRFPGICRSTAIDITGFDTNKVQIEHAHDGIIHKDYFWKRSLKRVRRVREHKIRRHKTPGGVVHKFCIDKQDHFAKRYQIESGHGIGFINIRCDDFVR